jgi:predicted RNase H-like HicB family nuclease
VEKIVNLHIEKLPERVCLATSDDLPGLVAQGRTITETLEIARDMAKKLLETQLERQRPVNLPTAEDVFDYPMVVGS